MNFMMWKEKYSIGVDRIDNQHKELFIRLSNFINIVQNDMDWEEKLDKVKETMEFMQSYVLIHFSEEEEYQKKINYPEFKEHKKAHDEFKMEINKYVEILEENGFTEVKIQEFAGKLMTWLIMHVCHMDQKIGEYVKSKGGKI